MRDPVGNGVGAGRTRRTAFSARRTKTPPARSPATLRASTGAEGDEPWLQEAAMHSVIGVASTGVVTLAEEPSRPSWATMSPGAEQPITTRAGMITSQRHRGATRKG